MSIHTKQPQVDLRFFELPATIALIEAIRNPLIIDLKHKKFKKLTSQELSIFLGRLQIFQEEKSKDYEQQNLTFLCIFISNVIIKEKI
ncbi:14379_t:CDS:2 [Entrophospora sp. SA101]|nr:14379_t:CDS:2 [Entrophospora sp. SA101]